MTTFPVPTNDLDYVLVASPSSAVRERVLASLNSQARHVEQVRGGAEALLHLESGLWQKLFLDKRLSDLDVEELTRTVQQRYPHLEVVLMDHVADGGSYREEAPSLGTISSVQENAIEDVCGSNGDPTDHDPVPPSVHGIEFSEAGNALVALPGMIGHSANMRAVYRNVRLVAGRDTTVLITGPTGSGKELVARALHELSPRAGSSFVVVNCAAIPETLLESELFGYSRGAFTGAQQPYAGRIHAAHLGTLFLDEIGDMPLSLQPKLLRFLEHKELQRLGSSQTVRVDVRIVAATNLDLVKAVSEGKFREDLYYRLSTFPLFVPPLKERAEDIAELANHFLQEFSLTPPTPSLSSDALRLLQVRDWRGNVRELQNVMERALIIAQGDPVIRPAHLGIPGQDLDPSPSLGRRHQCAP